MKADKTNNYAYSKKLQTLANKLRKEVLKNMNGVMERIERVVVGMEISSPPLTPPPAGGQRGL